jgi:hypothetical protein
MSDGCGCLRTHWDTRTPKIHAHTHAAALGKFLLKLSPAEAPY